MVNVYIDVKQENKTKIEKEKEKKTMYCVEIVKLFPTLHGCYYIRIILEIPT